MKLIVGLGNPGEKYKNARHNVGHMVIDKVKSENLKLKSMIIAKTNIFMNNSGSFVKKMFTDHCSLSTDHLYIIHDDLDLPLGTWKMQFAKGPKDNGGINSIEQVLGTNNFWRIRVGIDNRNSEARTPGEEYTLEDFTKDEKVILDKVINDVCRKLTRGLWGDSIRAYDT